ncbi:porin family protein [Variovorax saccharolyticus]|uniref:porin family protein n=1 Tax=Variovorax saccharolyticus TaxID=3053516 RepID=UPI002576D050|nr:porin family protein [Variovorax sp. J31P216]MDM0024795.1 porin family protein [Variovorax sp. J31P216]
MSRRKRWEKTHRAALCAFVGSLALLGAGAASAAEPDPVRAREIVEAAQRTPPDSVAAHLELGRAYFVLGQYAEAKIEFETVLRFDSLPQDLLSQVEIYNKAANQALDEKRSLTGFGYAETGIGRYRVNSTRGTDAFGGGDRRDDFVNARVGGGLNYALPNGYALDASLDYRGRYYDNSDSRNDSDLRWRVAGSRSFGENNLAVGLRGRNSYRGDSDFRNDAGLFADYRYRVDPDNQLTLGAEYRRRRYPEGPLRERSRTSADISGGWVHSLLDGSGSLTVTAHGGQHFATSRPDGNSNFYGATVALDFTVNNKLSWGTFAWWERDAFNADRIHFHPDTLDNSVFLRRKDNLYEVGAYLVWEFVPTWTLRPELLWIRDQSNSVGFNYSSTEFWLNVRKAF